jgi:hypothetical protein
VNYSKTFLEPSSHSRMRDWPNCLPRRFSHSAIRNILSAAFGDPAGGGAGVKVIPVSHPSGSTPAGAIHVRNDKSSRASITWSRKRHPDVSRWPESYPCHTKGSPHPGTYHSAMIIRREHACPTSLGCSSLAVLFYTPSLFNFIELAISVRRKPVRQT